MIENPESFKGSSLIFNSTVLTYAGVLLISTWAGLVSFFTKKRKFTWASLFAHLLSSSFAGVMAYLFCTGVGVPGALIGVICGIAGHTGTPAFIKALRKIRVINDLLGDEE